MDVFARLKAFRQAAYIYLCRAHDATFELTDAVLVTRNAYCERRFFLVSGLSTQVAQHL